jgi:hypothetical protein
MGRLEGLLARDELRGQGPRDKNLDIYVQRLRDVAEPSQGRTLLPRENVPEVRAPHGGAIRKVGERDVTPFGDLADTSGDPAMKRINARFRHETDGIDAPP